MISQLLLAHCGQTAPNQQVHAAVGQRSSLSCKTATAGSLNGSERQKGPGIVGVSQGWPVTFKDPLVCTVTSQLLLHSSSQMHYAEL